MPLQVTSLDVVETTQNELLQAKPITRDASGSLTASITAASSSGSISSGSADEKATRSQRPAKDDDTLDGLVATVMTGRGKGDDGTCDGTLATVEESLDERTLDDTLVTVGESTMGEERTLVSEDDSTLAGSSLVQRYMTKKRGRHVQFSTVKALSFSLEGVSSMARLGKNKTLRKKCLLPSKVLKEDIHVHVILDEGRRRSQETVERLLALGSKNPEETTPLSQRVLKAVRDDLEGVYTATAEEAKVMLCVVIVVASDGSMSRAITDKNSVMGLAEIGFAYRLFDADDLTLFDGGIVAKRHEISRKLKDYNWSENEGLDILMKKLIPQAGNDLVSRMGHVNNELLVEI